jgi:hypothetical protein
VFRNLPAGNYILTCNLTKLEWMTGGQLAQAGSPLALGSLSQGKPLTVKTIDGTFHRDAQGNWTPPGAMVRRWKDVSKALVLSNGQRQKVSLP